MIGNCHCFCPQRFITVQHRAKIKACRARRQLYRKCCFYRNGQFLGIAAAAVSRCHGKGEVSRCGGCTRNFTIRPQCQPGRQGTTLQAPCGAGVTACRQCLRISHANFAGWQACCGNGGCHRAFFAELQNVICIVKKLVIIRVTRKIAAVITVILAGNSKRSPIKHIFSCPHAKCSPLGKRHLFADGHEVAVIGKENIAGIDRLIINCLLLRII